MKIGTWKITWGLKSEKLNLKMEILKYLKPSERQMFENQISKLNWKLKF